MATTKNGNDTPNLEQLTSEYFESIKGNHAALRQFFTAMPKGGDVHNHLTGSAYAETYFELAAKKGMYVNPETGRLYAQKPMEVETIQLSKDMDDLHNHRMALIDKWSIRNFQPYKYPLGPDEYFFGTFGLLSALTGDAENLACLMHELKVRAVKENVQYLEVMATSPVVPANCFLDDAYDTYDEQLKECVKNGTYDEPLKSVLNAILKLFDTNADATTEAYLASIRTLDQLSNQSDHCDVDTSNVVCRYQGYSSRGSEPLKVFAQLYVVHKACAKDSDNLLVGCNIVAAENGEKSMLYYRLHMEMFAALATKFSTVNTSLHAGELTLGLGRPEHLTYHIRQAVKTAQAHRIGHGVDLPFEQNSDELLKAMKEKIPVEINLTSNEFILGVKDTEHPITLYHKAGIPIIISTDDPGILRTSLTEQYTLAALRYGFSYKEIKEFVNNSITYSFLPDHQEKGDNKKYEEMEKLKELLTEFEKKFLTEPIPEED
ncbi:adenosine deaminase family protein [Bacteroides thetaiotaomicron]|uniref:adenosine deaminase family protein n=1 Tax=Bacteroides thetaiotaomicron TaxID=818 RepID=UPI00406307B4